MQFSAVVQGTLIAAAAGKPGFFGLIASLLALLFLALAFALVHMDRTDRNVNLSVLDVLHDRLFPKDPGTVGPRMLADKPDSLHARGVFQIAGIALCLVDIGLVIYNVNALR